MDDQRVVRRPSLGGVSLLAASSSRALAPSPYTVSVGNATSPPCFRICPAAFIMSIFICVFLSFYFCLHVLYYSINPPNLPPSFLCLWQWLLPASSGTLHRSEEPPPPGSLRIRTPRSRWGLLSFSEDSMVSFALIFLVFSWSNSRSSFCMASAACFPLSEWVK